MVEKWGIKEGRWRGWKGRSILWKTTEDPCCSRSDDFGEKITARVGLVVLRFWDLGSKNIVLEDRKSARLS